MATQEYEEMQSSTNLQLVGVYMCFCEAYQKERNNQTGSFDWSTND